MIPSCFLWKVVIFFGKQHVNWSSISGDMIGRSWTIKFGKIHYLFGVDFPNLIFQFLPIITPLILDQLTWSLPKNVTTFHGQQEGIIHFCLSPNKRVVLAIWMKLSNWVLKCPSLFGKNINSKCQNTNFDFSKIDYSTSSYHNSTIIGPVDMFYTKKCNYFSRATRWNHPFLS